MERALPIFVYFGGVAIHHNRGAVCIVYVYIYVRFMEAQIHGMIMYTIYWRWGDRYLEHIHMYTESVHNAVPLLYSVHAVHTHTTI